MPSLPRNGRGFTLIELLVVMGVIALLIALLLPALQQSWAASHRTQCLNNLRQIGLALQNYHDASGMFPFGYLDTAGMSGVQDGGWSWQAQILPQLDQRSLFDAFDFRYHPHGQPAAVSDPGGRNQAAVATPLSVFSCPTDDKPPSVALYGPAEPGHATLATSSYSASMGAFHARLCAQDGLVDAGSRARHADGLFVVNECRAVRDVTDGTSQTIAVGETRWWDTTRNVLYGSVRGDGQADCSDVSTKDGGPFRHLKSARLAMNTPKAAAPRKYFTAFGSVHPGGAHFLMADGSARFLSETLSHSDTNYRDVGAGAPFNLYQRLAAMNDGRITDEF